MKPIVIGRQYLMVLVSLVLIFAVAGCASTTQTITKKADMSLLKGGLYAMGSCEIREDVAAQSTCPELQEHVQYGLLKKGLYKPGNAGADKVINLTITSSRSVSAMGHALAGPLTGGNKLVVLIDIVDKTSGKLIEQSVISSTSSLTAFNTTDKMMIRRVGNRLVEYLSGGAQ